VSTAGLELLSAGFDSLTSELQERKSKNRTGEIHGILIMFINLRLIAQKIIANIIESRFEPGALRRYALIPISGTEIMI
jgi:hypothetical protein